MKVDTPMTQDRTAIVLAARRMIHAAKVKRQWGDGPHWPAAANACAEYLADGASEPVKAAALKRLEEEWTIITGLPKSTD